MLFRQFFMQLSEKGAVQNHFITMAYRPWGVFFCQALVIYFCIRLWYNAHSANWELRPLKFDNTHVTIDLDKIVSNFETVRKKAGVPVLAVVKADAYGHGAIQVARSLQDRCAFFGVSSMLEAMELRNAGIATPILILGQIPTSAFATAIRENVRPCIFRYEDALALSRTAQDIGLPAYFHLVVDTGMSRIGFQATEEDAEICAKICRLPGIVPEGIFSHFATADCADLSKARAQAERFDGFVEQLKARGVTVPMRHMDNSAGIMNFTGHYELVRAGIVLYGMYPSTDVNPADPPLQPALSWSSRVTHVKTLEPGREISYGGAYVTEKTTVVATIPVGYADGYRRALSGKFYVLIRGKKAPILGRICMDQMMVDVTDIPDVTVGDKVTLIGTDGELTITLDAIATAADSFNYEFMCGISRRVPRFYLRNGQLTHQVHYLLDSYE